MKKENRERFESNKSNARILQARILQKKVDVLTAKNKELEQNEKNQWLIIRQERQIHSKLSEELESMVQENQDLRDKVEEYQYSRYEIWGTNEEINTSHNRQGKKGKKSNAQINKDITITDQWLHPSQCFKLNKSRKRKRQS